ncbi:MAG: ABC transporter permease subunit, partial [Rhodoferax sp.]|nr:ABC transporter permease subunit [Rhodoferax sp.]
IAILLVTILGRDFYLVVQTITVFSWMDMARVVRGQTLSLRSMEYVEAARAVGVSTPRIIFRHIVPNLMGVVVIYTTVTVPGVILTESVLSFLGLGIQEPMTSWGVLIQDGAKAMEVAPWILLFPAGLLSVTLYCFNFIGDGMRDALDPKER